MKQCSQNYYGICWQNGSGHLGVSYDPATWQSVSEYSCATQVDAEEAIERANATRFGLAASVWGENSELARKLSSKLKSGTVWLNCHNRLFAEAETGGYRESGYGRLHGLQGLDDFMSTKHLYWEDH